MLLCNVSFGDTIELAGEDSWPPFTLSSGEGISKNIIKAAYAESGKTVNFSISPYIRVLKLTEDGEVDGCFNVTKQLSTEEKFIFGQEPLLQAKASFYYSSSGDSEFSSIKDIPKGSSIAVIRGYEYGDTFEKVKKNFSISEVNSQEQIIRMIISKRIVGAIMFDDVANYHLQKMNKVGSLKKGFFNHQSDIYVAFSKKRPNSKENAELLDKGIRALKEKKLYKPFFK
jgi:polar amino acid transport system substrate-binding protein